MELTRALIAVLTEHTVEVAENGFNCSSDIQRLLQVLQHVDGLLHDKEGLELNAARVLAAMIPLRELIFEAHDVITDCIVRDEFNDSYIPRLFSRLFSRFDMPFMRNTNKKLNDISSGLDKHLANLGRFLQLKEGLKVDNGIENSQGEELALQDFNPITEVGLDKYIHKIRDWIVGPDQLEHHRVAVCGMAGTGKTAIVQKILSDVEVSRFYQTRIFVVVSTNNKYRILTSILSNLGGKIPDSTSLLMGEVRNAVLKKNGCLVVMDDVWSISDVTWWNDLCTALEVKGRRSCIVVATRNEDVANIAVRGDLTRIYKLRTLDDENSWLLFSQIAHPGPEFERIGKEIVKNCGGLPLSIKIVGSLLAGNTALSEWMEVLDYFHAIPVNGGNVQVMRSLRLSYDDLEPHLKQCLLCFSLYPENCKIRADHVIHWWLAEGILTKRNSKKSTMELGHEYLSALISRCLVEVDKRQPYYGIVYTCKVHDMVREMIMTIAEEEGFCGFNEQGVPIWSEYSYWLCLNDEVRDEGRLLFKENSKLRAAVLMSGHEININKDSGQLTSLRMLDLSGGTITRDPVLAKNLLDWIVTLPRLACLNLTGFEVLEDIPSSIDQLCNLQVLVLAGCSNLRKLPESVTKLRKLIVLNLENCPRLEYLPRGVENLTKLQELSGFKVTIGGEKSKGTCGLTELASLTELRVLHITISSDHESNLSKIKVPRDKNLSRLKKLKTLGIDAQSFRKGWHIINGFNPSEALGELYLRNYHGNKLPDWIDPSRLKMLRYLCIERAENVADWNPKPVKWEGLRGLRLMDMKKLNADWTSLKKVMPALKYSEIIGCHSLKNLREAEKNDGIW